MTPLRRRSSDRLPRFQRPPRRARLFDAVEPQQRQRRRPTAAPSVPTGSSPSSTGVPGARGRAVELDPDDALARAAAVLHARDDLLADIAAFVEIDAVEQRPNWPRAGRRRHRRNRRRPWARRARCAAPRSRPGSPRRPRSRSRARQDCAEAEPGARGSA